MGIGALKAAGMVMTVIGGAAGIAGSIIDSQRQEQLIKEEVRKQISEQESKKES